MLLGEFAEQDVAAGSHIARLGAIAPRLDWDRPVRPQLDAAAHAFDAEVHASLRRDLSSRPGQAAGILRREMYRLMRLPEPECPARLEPVPLPCPVQRGRWAA